MIGSIALTLAVVGPLVVMVLCAYMFMKDLEYCIKRERDLADGWRNLYELEKLNFAEACAQYEKLKKSVTKCECPHCASLVKTLEEAG